MKTVAADISKQVLPYEHVIVFFDVRSLLDMVPAKEAKGVKVKVTEERCVLLQSITDNMGRLAKITMQTRLLRHKVKY